jgi:hypothetical protein
MSGAELAADAEAAAASAEAAAPPEGAPASARTAAPAGIAIDNTANSSAPVALRMTWDFIISGSFASYFVNTLLTPPDISDVTSSSAPAIPSPPGAAR